MSSSSRPDPTSAAGQEVSADDKTQRLRRRRPRPASDTRVMSLDDLFEVAAGEESSAERPRQERRPRPEHRSRPEQPGPGPAAPLPGPMALTGRPVAAGGATAPRRPGSAAALHRVRQDSVAIAGGLRRRSVAVSRRTGRDASTAYRRAATTCRGTARRLDHWLGLGDNALVVATAALALALVVTVALL